MPSDAMEEEPTQLTQQVLDPRRLGRNNSGLNDDDIADVILILHPATPMAMKIVENAARTRPEHVLFRNSLDSFDDSIADIEEQETIIITKSGQRLGQTSSAAADLALRMSSVNRLLYKQLGFIFGRNPNSSDIVLGQDTGKRISNQHFRIYLNTDGVLMIEDLSTNGTIVDDVLLKNKDKRFSKFRMLNSGSVICLQSSIDAEIIRFVVRVPSRVSHVDRFRDNVRAFVTECAEGEDKAKVLQHLGKEFGGPTMKWDGGVKYNIIGHLGKGAFATVHQLATKMDGKLLAAKELEKRRFMKNGQLDKKIDNEMKIMQGLRHPNIVDFVEYHDEGEHLYIIMEFVRYGDLQAYLNQNGPMKEHEARSMAQQILSALNYLHRSKITHRDIKPDNILIADLNPIKVKLSDFGLSKVVKHDETFLKTFCGTLLYCAPEVFPDFGGGPTQGTKRRRGTKQFHSYSSSVDIWSFGGVLWYALCGEPPFKGIADATGEAMYKNIMSTRLDAAPLRQAKVSNACIDLLLRMLRTDPALRPTERDCLSHPWLREGATIPTDPALQSIVEEGEEEEAEQQLSQLSIREEIPESDEEANVLSDDEFGMLVESRPKRIRIDPLYPRNQIRDYAENSSADPSFHSEHVVEGEESFKLMPVAGRARLFGEIGQSALQSSGILNDHVNQALSHEGSAGQTVPEVVPDSSHTAGQGRRQTPPVTRSQFDGAFASPSLLGAESLVRELNMASPQSPISGAHSPNEPATPRTPDVPQHNSLEQSTTHSSQFSEPTPKAKPPPLDRQISLPKTASFYYDPFDPSTHTLEYASKVSGFDFVGAAEAEKLDASELEDTMRVSGTDGDVGRSVGSTTSAVPAVVPPLPAELDIKPPPRRLGRLTATVDSFAPMLMLNIDRSKTSWGRLPSNTIVYENSTDTRIPKIAFIIFWYSSSSNNDSSVQELSQHGKDWTDLDDLHAGIFTCATSGITVNGKHLRKHDEKGRALFGHLHTGDIVQVYHDARGSETLKFKCEFYLGSGKQPRPTGETFNILCGSKLPTP